MEERFRKKSSAPSDIPSPVLLRRRLSAPETIMRKHMLAQQRSESQDSDVTQASDVRSCQWRMETGVGSDPNLNRKRDPGLMRKSTLMRRLWGSNKPLSERSSRLSGSYNDWQYGGKLSQGRSTQSLGSSHSSPEHLKCRSRTSLNGEDLRTSPVHKKYENMARKGNVNPKIQLRNQAGETSKIYTNGIDNEISKRKLVTNGNLDVQSTSFKTSCCSNYTYATSFENPTSSVDSRLSTTKTPTTMTTETESEHYSTRSTSTTGTTTFSDNSDSAYTNSRSNFTHTSNENSSTYTSTRSSERFVEENGNIAENENSNQYVLKKESNLPETKGVDKSNNARTRAALDKVNDSSTQTTDTANLNVISNVQLSQSTLNLIFNQVMQDVQKSPSTNINISTVSANIPLQSNTDSEMLQPKLIQVQQVPSFYLKQKEEIPAQEQHRILKYMVSNVGTGSPYSKPPEVPQVVVPRYSALPRTASMEVNTSSGESTDKESDNISLVDSLEDPSSPRVDMNQNTRYDERPVRGDLSSLLPDNSSSKLGKTSGKASAFFIPIEANVQTDVKSVTYHMPEKVRERLTKRQLKREQKLRQAKDKILSPKSDSNYVSASDNGNQLSYAVDNAKYMNNTSSVLPDINLNKSKRKAKPMLPSIENIRKVKTDFKPNLKQTEIEKNKDKKLNKPSKRKFLSKSQDIHMENLGNEKKPNWMHKTRHKMLERLSPLCATKTDYMFDALPKTIYHKTEVSNLNKRIEILEIVECIESIPDSSVHRLPKTKKSKIPVLVQSKLPSISRDDKTQRPVFLDFEQMHEVEPKIDQLIANILIDALNKTDLHGEEKQKFTLSSPLTTTEKRPPATQSPQTRHQGNKYQQTFESIPEERTASLQSSSEDASNTDNFNDVPNKEKASQAPGKTSQEEDAYTKRYTSSHEAASTKSAPPDGYKGKAALGILKDENFSAIPKGWITFYTLHKSQGSPESTSDEGKKKVMGNESTNYNGNVREDVEKHTKLDKFPEDDKTDEKNLRKSKSAGENRSLQQNIPSPEHNEAYMIPSKEANLSQDSIDTWTSSDQEKRMRVLHPLPPTGYVQKNQQKKGRYKTCDPSSTHKSGWSVTVSGTTSGRQYAPDLEMRLTFPRSGKNVPANQNSGFGEENSRGKRGNFPYLIPPKENNCANPTSRTDNSCGVQQLPQIGRHKSTKKLRQCDSGQLINIKNSMEPRQTRTSSRRLLLNRPRTFITPAEFIDINTDDSNLKEILAKFPEILKITGNAISPERKPRVPTMSEKDVTRQLYRNT